MEVSVGEARALLAATVEPARDVEVVALTESLGRVLASDLECASDVPPFDNSAMDGYALASSSKSPLRVVGVARAGQPWGGAVGDGDCVRILTGAAIPRGCDAVIAQEKAKRDGDVVSFEGAVASGLNVRRAGEDLARGATVLPRGRVLRAADLGAIASLGVSSVGVFRRPRVGAFTTGDELVRSGPLGPGQLYDSNKAILIALVRGAGAEAVDLGHARDDEAELEALASTFHGCDVVISTGGVAVGDTDCVPRALGARSIEVAMKPGRHLAYARHGSCAYFALPGNPVAVIATFHALVAPALRRAMGASERSALVIRAKLATAVRNAHARTDFQRGIFTREDSGELAVRPTGPQGAGILRSVIEGNCFILVPPGPRELAEGSWVDIEPFDAIDWM